MPRWRETQFGTPIDWRSQAIRAGVVVTACVSVWLPASTAVGDDVLASVGDHRIATTELEEFALVARHGLSSELTKAQADSALLRSLIDKTVLLLEVESQGIESEPWFGKSLDARVNGEVAKLYLSRTVNQQISIEEEEVQEGFVNTHRNRALRFAGIMVETREEAQEVARQLEQGADFASLAAERSLYDMAMRPGGDVGRYMGVDDTMPQLWPIFTLSVGEISEPLPVSHKDRQGYAIFKVMDEMPVQLESVRDKIREEIFARKRARRQQVVLDSLKEVYAPEIETDNVAAVAAQYGGEGWAPDLREVVLCTYEGGSITLDDLLASFGRTEGSADALKNVEWIGNMLADQTIPSHLSLAAARGGDWHLDPQILQFRERFREDMLLNAMHEREVSGRVPETTQQEARAFYDGHPEKFQTWEKIVVNEILVSDIRQAEELRKRLDDGADAAELAGEYTIREGFAHHDGRLTLNKGSQYRYGTALYEAAKEVEVGGVGGPVEQEDGYSVFKVIEHEPATTKPFHEFSKKRAKAYVQVERVRRVFVEYVRTLWEKYEVEVFVDYL